MKQQRICCHISLRSGIALALGLVSIASTAAPSITSITTTYSAAGTPTAINIAGSAFCTTAAPANCATIPTLTLGGTVLAVTAAKANVVTATLPLLANGDYLLSLTAGTTGSVTYGLTIEALDAGATGPTGPTGAAGAAGAKGATGPTGAAGTAGAKGATGATGPTGPAGTSGSATVSVSTTTTGAPGSAASVTNTGTGTAAKLNFVIPQGPTGGTGAVGPTGPQGVQGPVGPNGQNGPTGPTGVGVFTDASYNTSVGSNMSLPVLGDSGFAGSGNSAVGDHSLGGNINPNASFNSALGVNSLLSVTTGTYNSAIGFSALRSNLTGGSNVAFGVESLRWSAADFSNTAIGTNALYSLNGGSNNSALGYSAGFYLTSGSNNIHIGNQGTATDTNLIRIGDANQTQTYIAGITTANLSADASALPVVIDSATGQLGVGAVVQGLPSQGSTVYSTLVRNPYLGPMQPIANLTLPAGAYILNGNLSAGKLPTGFVTCAFTTTDGVTTQSIGGDASANTPGATIGIVATAAFSVPTMVSMSCNSGIPPGGGGWFYGAYTSTATLMATTVGSVIQQ